MDKDRKKYCYMCANYVEYIIPSTNPCDKGHMTYGRRCADQCPDFRFDPKQDK